MKRSSFLLSIGLAGALSISGCSSTRARGAASSGGVSAGSEERYSVVVAGHIYSLYVQFKHEMPEPAIAWTRPMQAFAAEVERIDPELVFLLGDNTRYGRPIEWAFLERTFAPIRDRIRLGMGNHEYRNLEAFRSHGGLINRTIVHRGNKFILLDCKKIFEAHDLEFLRDEVADADDYEHVFVLMHYFLPTMRSPDRPLGDFDPYEPFPRMSNWNRDVVPILAGKVDAVITGDHVDSHLRNYVQQVGPVDLVYVTTSFRFGRGDELDQPGDGPMVFLELRFEDGDFRVLPRAVPLDARDDWYRNPIMSDYEQNIPRILGVTVFRHALPGAELSIELSNQWEVSGGSDGKLTATVPGDEPLELEVGTLAGELESADRLVSDWEALVCSNGSAPLVVESRTQAPVLTDEKLAELIMAKGRIGARDVARIGALFREGETNYYLTLTVPESHWDTHLKTMHRLLGMIVRAR